MVVAFVLGDKMSNMKEESKSNNRAWVVAVVAILGGIYLVSQWQSSSQQNQMDKVIKAKQACRWDGERQGWDTQAIATCNRLGEDDYNQQTDHYYEMYNAKLQYGL